MSVINIIKKILTDKTIVKISLNTIAPSERFVGKKVLVTGGGSGIGFEIASLPIGYIFFKFGCPAYIVFLIILAIEIVGMFAIWWLVHNYEYFPYRNLFSKVLVPSGVVTLITISLPLYIINNYDDGWIRFFSICLISEVLLLISALYVGLNSEERGRLFSFVRNKLNHNKNVN